VGAGAANIIGYSDHILEIGTPTNTVAISVTDVSAIVKIVVAEIIADTAYNITAGSLHLICSRLSGSRTGTPIFEVSPSTLSGTNTGDVVVEDEGTPVTQRSTLNFTGAGVTCTDTGAKTQCSIPGGGGGLSPSVLSFGGF
jgi:hypothetical protein